MKRLDPTMPSRGRIRRFGGQALAWLLCLALLSACAPPGARNWPFSIGPRTYAVALGDLDGDGDLDAFLANGENEVPVPNTVWLNDGEGRFSDSGQQIGERESQRVILVDMDADRDLDALVADTSNISIYLNNGQGEFGSSGEQLGQPGDFSYVARPAVGDVNGDGYPDVFAGRCCGAIETWDDNRRLVHPPVDSLWLSDGQGGFVDSSQIFDLLGTNSIALGDLDGDGHLDAFFGNATSYMDQTENIIRNQPNTVWFNDGQGRFWLSAQQIGNSEAASVALSDLDGDGDLDAFVGNQGQDEVWLNAGGAQGGRPGTFIAGGTVGDAEQTRSVALADLDGDGDLDALIVYRDSARVWLNDGLAGFTDGQELTFERQHALALGDLDGDGHIDIFAGSVHHDVLVWFNDGEAGFR
ncbi:MAG TPA: VCBS repeat-containing protein [Anaerolineales bacterium]|nr:VCBS repeat-containing protein [Anaerolineales bacterium]